MLMLIFTNLGRANVPGGPRVWRTALISSGFCNNHRLGGINNRNVFPHSFGGRKSKIKVMAGLVSF